MRSSASSGSPSHAIRTTIQFATATLIVFILVVVLDNRFRVLPQAIHQHLPAHHEGLVITDLTVSFCSSYNVFSSCKLDPAEWHRIEKDLYLNTGWVHQAYVHVKRKKEEELSGDEQVIIDVKCGRLDPAVGEKNKGNEKWESRPAGVWILRSSKRHESDSKEAVTAVDVLFGADAVEPRLGWRIRDTPLLLESPADSAQAHISIRRGRLKKVDTQSPRIRKDGKFKIMQVADLHLSTGVGKCRDAEPPEHDGGTCEADTRTLQFVSKLLDTEAPDLVVLSGDQVNGETAPDVQSSIFKFVDLFVNRKDPIPYAAIFGNHDDNGPLSRHMQMSLLESLPYSLSQPGPSTIDGVGNYVVEVLASGTSANSALSLYMLDTHGLSPDEKHYKGYDWLKDSQIRWFQETVQQNRRKHKQYAKIHLDMAFIHIPLPEYKEEKKNQILGDWKEPPTAPGFNSGFRDVLAEEGVSVVSCGHDHVNDYCALPKDLREAPPHDDHEKENTSGKSSDTGANALWMCYGGGVGFGGYGGYGGYHRRVRFFEVDTGTGKITTWKRLEYGDTERRLHEQVLVDGGKVLPLNG
ncbi:MAG: hypothetical protein M1831_003957 [Alyxoria varia]|nr:MAG: hypothetical protein M1831_003957 [Alyxoria varia]